MNAVARKRTNNRGTVSLIVLGLLAVMCLFLTINARTLYSLKTSVKLVEKKQLQYWTNSVSGTNKTESRSLQ